MSDISERMMMFFYSANSAGNQRSAIEESGTKNMHIGDSQLGQFLASVKSRNQTIDLMHKFLQSRRGKGAKHMAAVQPTDELVFVVSTRYMWRVEAHGCA